MAKSSQYADEMYSYYIGSSYLFNGSINSIPAEPMPVEAVLTMHPAAKVFLLLSYTLTFIVCGIGDTFLCFLILRHQRLRSVTNLLIANLAVSDVIVAIFCVPIKLVYFLSMNWVGGEFLCKLVGTLNIVSMFVSVNTLLVIAIDRYVGIFWPLRPRLKKTTLAIIILAIWTVSLLVALPTPLNIWMESGKSGGEEVNICLEYWYDRRLGRAYVSFIAITEFLLPFFMMGFIYFSIAKRLWFHRILPGNQTDQNREISLVRKRKTIPTLITVVVAFFFCWAPYYGFNLALQFEQRGFENMESQLSVYFVVESIATLNSVISTIIYLFMSPIFRAELVMLWKPIVYGQRRYEKRNNCGSHRGRYHIPSRTNSNMSHTKNGSLNVVRKSSHETGEARL